MKIDIDKLVKKPLRGNVRYIDTAETTEEYAKQISALANTDGGIMLLGIKDEGVNLKLLGFPFRQPNREELIDSLNGFDGFSIEPISYDTKSFVLVHVKKKKAGVKYKGQFFVFANEYSNDKFKQIKPVNIFISYNHKVSELADILENELLRYYSYKINFNRDTQLSYKDNIDDFMKSIKQNDIIISLVSDSYLKSPACMYEISELRKDDNYESRLAFIVLDEHDVSLFKNKIPKVEDLKADVYSDGRYNYMIYWSKKYDKYLKLWSGLNRNPDAAGGLQREMVRVKQITSNTDSFIEMLHKNKGSNFSQMKRNNYKEIKGLINMQLLRPM